MYTTYHLAVLKANISSRKYLKVLELLPNSLAKKVAQNHYISLSTVATYNDSHCSD
jgi:hypothetical protein